jgi:hypothetical protein
MGDVQNRIQSPADQNLAGQVILNIWRYGPGIALQSAAHSVGRESIAHPVRSSSTLQSLAVRRSPKARQCRFLLGHFDHIAVEFH